MADPPHNPVGASLLAMAVGQLATILNVPPSSRAGSLPQGGVGSEALRRLLELLPVLVRRQVCVLAEQPCEEARVVVADFVADGLDALAAAGE